LAPPRPEDEAAGVTEPDGLASAADPDDPEDDEHALSIIAAEAAITATAAPARRAADGRVGVQVMSVGLLG
jgi:hypothetical protein